MKNIIIGLAIAAIPFVACNNSNTTKENSTTNDKSGVKSQQLNKDTGAPSSDSFSTKEILVAYLQLKNSLAKDNGKEAADACNDIVAILAKTGKVSLSPEKTKAYADLEGDIKENAEHIGANADKIAHQREHFEMLSRDMADLVQAFGNSGQILYKDFCPMYNNGKGAAWISETKEIKNPYLGSKMSTCGSIKETIR